MSTSPICLVSEVWHVVAGIIADLYIDSFKFRGQNVKSRVEQLMTVLQNYTHDSLLEYFMSAPAWATSLYDGSHTARGRRPACQSAQMSKITNDGLTRSDTGCFIAVPIWQQSASDQCFTAHITAALRAWRDFIIERWNRLGSGAS